jgi:hypothetical protein
VRHPTAFALAAAVAMPIALASVAAGAPAASEAAPVAATAATACVINDHRIIGLSGLVVTRTGYVVVSDSNTDKRAIRIWLLDRRCHLVRSISYPTSAYDPEDAAVGRDGTIYVADIGDNGSRRTSIGLWRIPPGSTRPHLYRYRYPDHAHDAEALLLAADDSPILVTKEPGVSQVFVPTGPPDPSGRPVALRAVGTFAPVATGTTNGLGLVGNLLVTGGANAPDRTTVALRTYSDAYVWDVRNGDVVKTVTTTSPRIVPLPNEPQGESVAFDSTGTRLFTVSDREATPVHTPILEYDIPTATGTGGTPRPSPSPSAIATGPSSSGAPAPSGRASFPYQLIAVGVAVLAVTAVAARGARRRRQGP